ncbi:SMCs flexible hinge [Entophlyctis helioformis]|nr:SMCs flexible hinge [Entophlyctis helioformis]
MDGCVSGWWLSGTDLTRARTLFGQVVVESEVVGSQLLQRGNLKHRVTIIPINKIKAFKVQAECIANAKRLAPGSVDLALSLVGYPQELAVVMDYVFGSTLLCKDPATAKLVAFDNGVRMRSVTLDGDLYEPNGQLTGGSRSSSAGALLEMQHLKALRAQRQEIVARLDQISADLNDLLRTKDIAMGLKHQIELKTHEKKMLEERMANNPSMLIVKHAADLKTEIQTLQEKLAAAKKRMAESEKQCASIEKEIKEFSSDKGSKLKSIRVGCCCRCWHGAVQPLWEHAGGLTDRARMGLGPNRSWQEADCQGTAVCAENAGRG